MFAEVLPVFPSLGQSFHYTIPDELKVEAGHLVQVSFGQQLIQGIVVALSDDPPQGVRDFKPVQALIDEQPVLTRAQLDLGYYIAHHTLAPLSDCLTLMLPPGLAKQGDTEYELVDEKFDPQSEMQFQLVKLLTERGALRGKQIERAIPKKNWRGTMTTLIKRSVIKKRAVLQPPSVRPKLIRTARSIVPTDRLAAEKLKLKYSPRHADILDHLFGVLPGQPALDDLLKATHSIQSDLQPLIERDWIELTSSDSVISPTYPPDVMQKWIHKHSAKHRDAADVLRALCQNPNPIPLKALPNATPEVIQLLNEKDLIRLSTNPARVVLKLSGAQAAKQTQALRKPNKRVAVLDYLAKQDHAVPASWIYAETGADANTLKDLAERDLIDLGEEETIRDPLANEVFAPFDPPLLTDDQQNIWREIEAAIKFSPKTPSPFLIHGVTGSGKTEIYLRAVAATLEKKLRALVLVPEIALTPQTVRRFAARFPNRVTVLHSELSDGQRYDMWRRARAGAVDIVIGPRSALFAPLPDIGLIIVDEEHDESYYQNDTPHYNARDVAVEYARRVNAVCLLGSATPDLVSYTKAKRGEYRLLEMPQRIMAHGEYLAQQAERLNLAPHYHSLSNTAKYMDLPEVSVVDMRQELRVGNVSIFSRALQTAMNESLEAKQQIILFLNRRGTATHIFCRDCGYIVICSQCGTPLTYHGDENQLQCHHCGKTKRKPPHCPQCKSNRIKYFGAGTERVVEEATKLFPDARTLRWDRDTTRMKGAHDLILRQFRDQQADILIGTQMIAKGLDLPLVTLVGVVSADTGLNMPDYRACERVFQILTQVSGRAGRSLLGGRVILQTYQPEHYVIQASSKHDFIGFYQQELENRKQYSYPPYGKLVRLVFYHRKNDQAEIEARQVAELIRKRMRDAEATTTTLIGPAPCFFDRLDGEYRWQIILRGPNPSSLVPKERVRGWRVEVEPLSLL